jgi:molecular chaperone GrpE
MTEQAKPTPETTSREGNGAGGKEPTSTADLAALKSQLQSAEQARDEYLTLVKQTRAEFENYQKRNARELASERRYAQAPLAGDLLSALDNLDRAIQAGKQAGETGPLVQGVALVQSQLLDVLRRHGITPIEAQGKAFDPNLHQAVMQQPSAEVAPQTVLQVLEPGYMLHERVLRPARVIVSMPPA